ncbi:hypothetical protein [Streptomyces sp. NPDC046805]|uniref:hypothetical protein n=1 Tax=Streptomyces sp. NPDC046805 TaxID=3155134 RepID=UPI003405AD82
MSTVSAIPEHLIRYAAACTVGADQFQAWVRTALTPAMREYETSAGAVVCSALDTDVARQIAAAFYTDRNVRMAGLAFMSTQHGNVAVRDPKSPLSASDQAVNASYKILEQRAAQPVATPSPRPGQPPVPPHQPQLSDGVWDLVPPPMNLSYELQDAYGYTLPYTDPNGTKYSRRADAVLSWIEAHQQTINEEARRQGIDPRAIVAAIAWEALVNVHPYNPIPPTSPVGARTSVGPGKVHMNTALVKYVEEHGYMPRVSLAERERILSTEEGSIRYIAAIMRANADATERAGYGRYHPRDNIPLLTQVYQGGTPGRGQDSDPGTWEQYLRGKQGKDIHFENDMAKWSAEHPEFLNDALRPWQPGDAPPPQLRTPTPGPGPSPTPR